MLYLHCQLYDRRCHGIKCWYAECEVRRADARGLKGQVRGGVLGGEQRTPSPPARRFGGAL